jgi:hypothetical protein
MGPSMAGWDSILLLVYILMNAGHQGALPPIHTFWFQVSTGKLQVGLTPACHMSCLLGWHMRHPGGGGKCHGWALGKADHLLWLHGGEKIWIHAWIGPPKIALSPHH